MPIPAPSTNNVHIVASLRYVSRNLWSTFCSFGAGLDAIRMGFRSFDGMPAISCAASLEASRSSEWIHRSSYVLTTETSSSATPLNRCSSKGGNLFSSSVALTMSASISNFCGTLERNVWIALISWDWVSTWSLRARTSAADKYIGINGVDERNTSNILAILPRSLRSWLNHAITQLRL